MNFLFGVALKKQSMMAPAPESWLGDDFCPWVVVSVLGEVSGNHWRVWQ